MKTNASSRRISLAAAWVIYYCDQRSPFFILLLEPVMHVRFLPATLLVSCALLLAGQAHAGYKYSTLPTLGGPGSIASDINNAGQVVGTSLDNSEFPRSTVWTSGTPVDKRPGDWLSWGGAINNKGQIAGSYGDFYGRFQVSRAYASPHSDSSLGDLGVSDTGANDINNNGLVVGAAATQGWAGPELYPFPFYGSHAVAWNGSSTIDLNPAGVQSSTANAVNDSDVIVGTADGQAVTWNNGVMHSLGAGTAFDINNAGVIVGQSGSNAVMWNGGVQTVLGDGRANALNILSQVVGISNGHAFLWENGAATDLNNFLSAAAKGAGWILEEAVGINDHGWIVGNAFNTVTLGYQAFLLSPAPEPSTYAMMLLGLALIAWKARSRRRKDLPPTPAAA
jgi:uncharacterized membrane protein